MGGGWGVLKIKELWASCLITPRSFQIRGLLSYHLKLLLPMFHTITGVKSMHQAYPNFGPIILLQKKDEGKKKLWKVFGNGQERELTNSLKVN